VRAHYLLFGGEVASGTEVGYVFPGGRDLPGAPVCSCCGEPMRLLLALSARHEGGPEQLLAFQCRRVGHGGHPAVVALPAPGAPGCEATGLGGLAVGAVAQDDPDEIGEPDDEVLDGLLRPKLGGLFAFGDPDVLPACPRCGRRTRLALQLDEEPGAFNFATRSLVVGRCAEGHSPVLATALL
jgi:hypothetical protein